MESAQAISAAAAREPYDPALAMREARDHYFARFGFSNGIYAEKWVKLKAGPIAIYFPNIPSRVVAARYHDLHHILTEYPATWVGEGEIGAWEIATGCAHHWPAWVLNMSAMAVGLVIAPRRTYRGFIRGCSSTNLYRLPFNDALLARTVRSLREQLRLDEGPHRARPRDVARFAAWAALSVLMTIAPAAAIAVAFAWALH